MSNLEDNLVFLLNFNDVAGYFIVDKSINKKPLAWKLGLYCVNFYYIKRPFQLQCFVQLLLFFDVPSPQRIV
jgi:hypothetical protein